MSSFAPNSLTIPRSTVLSAVLALAVLSSSIVFSEPAPVDVLMAGFLVALCILGGARIGAVTTVNLICWLPVLALSFLGVALSHNFTTGLIHQIVTLFLVLAAVGIASFIAAEPAPRARLVLNCYVASITVACLLGYIGYFKLLPGADDLFTHYGRARGTFKDPNVFGAAVAPAITYLCWQLLRLPAAKSAIPALLCLFMTPALLISFSRGAWISLAVSLVVISFIAWTRTRRQSDRTRMAVYAVAGFVVVAATIVAVLQIPKVSDLMRERASLTQGYDEGPEGRFGGQKKAIRLILDNPAGIGTHTFRDIHHHEEVHNVYLTMFLNAGWIGGLLFIASMMLSLAVGLAGALKLGPLQGLFTVSTAALAGLAVEGLVIDSDHWRHLFIVLALIWGLSDARPVAASSPWRAHDPDPTTTRR
jgi:O-antigen ligase